MLWGLLHARLRLGGQRLLLLHRRRRRGARTTCRSCTASAASASSTEETLDHLSRLRAAPSPVRIGNGAYDQQPARRLGRAARLGLPAHEVARPAGRVDAGRSSREQVEDGDRALARARPRHLGGARRAASTSRRSKVMCWVACDRGARLARLRDDARAAPSAGRRAADEIHADICEHGVTSAASSPSTTTPTRSTRRCC